MMQHYKNPAAVWGEFNPVFPTLNKILDFGSNDELGIGGFFSICQSYVRGLRKKNMEK